MWGRGCEVRGGRHTQHPVGQTYLDKRRQSQKPGIKTARGNRRGTILGSGKNDCSKLQRPPVGVAVRALPESQEKQRMVKVKVS
jgi:hypothetical protein